MAFTLVTVTGTYKQEDGTPAAGTVTFVLTALMQDSGSLQMRAPVPITVTLDANGAFSQALTSTTTAGITPTGVSYQVTERIIGAPTRIYNVVV